MMNTTARSGMQYFALGVNSILVVLLAISMVSVRAQEAALSPAEQAAQALANDAIIGDMIKLCRHTLLYGSAASKADLVASLGDKTCEQAMVLSPADPESEE